MGAGDAGSVDAGAAGTGAAARATGAGACPTTAARCRTAVAASGATSGAAAAAATIGLPNGNTTSKTVGSTGTFYRWDAENRLVEAKQGASLASASTIASYVYDGNGKRLLKVPGDIDAPFNEAATLYIGNLYEKQIFDTQYRPTSYTPYL